MPVTITLSTVPGKLTRERGYVAKTIELYSPSLATEQITTISMVADIRAAVARFGTKVQAEHPDASFYVSVRLAKGHRNPNGYDAASRGNGLGQEEFMHVTDGRSLAAERAATASPVPAEEGVP